MLLPDPRASRAVLIGVSQYRHMSSFPAVDNNLRTLCELLTSARGWQLPSANCVTVLNPPSASAVANVIHNVARQAESGLLVYFAGHGLLDEKGELHLALTDSAPHRMHDAIPFATIRRELVRTAARCPAKVILIDSCYSAAAMTGFMGASPPVADLAVTDGAYIMAAAGEQAAASAPIGARYTAFTGALVKAVERGVPGGPAMLDMDTLYDQVMLDLRAQNLPLPQRRSRNDGHRIVLARNSAAASSPATKKAPAAATAVQVVPADLAVIRHALTVAAGGLPWVPMSKAGQVIKRVCPQIPAANWAGTRSLSRFVEVHLPDLRALAGDPAEHLRVRSVAAPPPSAATPKKAPAQKATAQGPTAPKAPPQKAPAQKATAQKVAAPPAAKKAEAPRRRASARAGRRDIDHARRVIRAALREQPLLPVETAAAILIREVPAIFESSWAGAGTCKLFLAKYLPNFPYTVNRTGGFIEAPPPFPAGVLKALRGRLTVKRVGRLTAAAVVVASLAYAGDHVLALVDQPVAADPTLKVTYPGEGRLTRDRYTIKVSKAAPAGQQLVAMVREVSAANSGTWTFHRCAPARTGSECANVPFGKKGSGKRMHLTLVVVDATQGRRLLGPPPPGFRGAPTELDPAALSPTYQYQR